VDCGKKVSLQVPEHRTQTFDGVVYTDGKMPPPRYGLPLTCPIRINKLEFRSFMDENTPEQDERQIAEDFRRQLQERALGGRTRPPNAELMRWLDENPELLEYIAHASWGAAPGTGLTPEQFKEELAAVPLVTPHDDPFTHAVVHMFSQQIECACRELGIPLYSGVAYGSTPELEVSANKYGVHFTQASVVTLSIGFITFCNSISGLIALSLPHERHGNELRVSFAPTLVLPKIRADADLKKYWEKVLCDYAIGTGLHHRLHLLLAQYETERVVWSKARNTISSQEHARRERNSIPIRRFGLSARIC
jgi:hypothetical protein